MNKLIIFAESLEIAHKITEQYTDLQQDIVGTATSARELQQLLATNPAAVLISPSVAYQLVAHPARLSARDTIKASTHQGIQLVPITDIYYFQAEHKYVNAYHKHGELLIEDSLQSLEQEFNAFFVRAHRKVLVAIDKIVQLNKHADGKYYLKLRDIPIELNVSRRQLPAVRKVLLCL